MVDASFEDGAERPVHLHALDKPDLAVISSLCQDAVFPVTEMTWRRKARQFAVLLNRFRWEDKPRAEQRGRPYERVQSVLMVRDVLGVTTQGIDRSDTATVLSLLAMTFEETSEGAGIVTLTLAGDGAVALQVECIDVTLKDVTRPYVAPSGKAPSHRL